MRIVHLSDLHFNSFEVTDIKNFINTPLVEDLKEYNAESKIDLIITGDLIDKGGSGEDPRVEFLAFEEAVIDPLLRGLNIGKDRIFFVPGNHDVVRQLYC